MSARRTFRIAVKGFARNYPSERRAYEAAHALLGNSPLLEEVTVLVREPGFSQWQTYETLTRKDLPS
jgi:hypothetical protein